MTPAWLPILGLLLAVEASPASAAETAVPAQGGRGKPAASAKDSSAPPAAEKPGAKPYDIPLPPPPALAARSAAPKPVQKAAPPVSPAPSAAGLGEGELLIQQKCSKCHDLSWIPAAELSDAQWRGHLKRPGVAITEEQAKQIQRALQSRRARSASR